MLNMRLVSDYEIFKNSLRQGGKSEKVVTLRHKTSCSPVSTKINQFITFLIVNSRAIKPCAVGI